MVLRVLTCPFARFNASLCARPDFVAVPVKILVNETVKVAAEDFKFYNCSAAMRRVENAP